MTYLEMAEHYAGDWLAWRLEQNLVANGYHGAVRSRPEPPMPDMEELVENHDTGYRRPW